jgi:hypothetical protein
MSGQSPDFPDDKTAPQRRKNLTEQEIKDLKLAGGVEGGMQAGSGGPEGAEDAEDAAQGEAKDLAQGNDADHGKSR